LDPNSPLDPTNTVSASSVNALGGAPLFVEAELDVVSTLAAGGEEVAAILFNLGGLYVTMKAYDKVGPGEKGEKNREKRREETFYYVWCVVCGLCTVCCVLRAACCVLRAGCCELCVLCTVCTIANTSVVFFQALVVLTACYHVSTQCRCPPEQVGRGKRDLYCMRSMYLCGLQCISV
jgi:hypothetical protein